MKVDGLQVIDEAGCLIDNPTPFQVRMALCQLLEATGSNVIKLTVDDILVAYVMAGNDEVPDAKADQYTQHLVTVAEHFLASAKSARRDFLSMAHGGSS